MIPSLVSSFFQVALLSFVLTFIILKIARKQMWFDKDPHDLHQTATHAASYGGVAIFVSFWIGSVSVVPQLLASKSNFWLFVASLIVLLVGMIDDTYELKPLQKTLGLFIAANILFFNGGISFSSNFLPIINSTSMAILSYFLTMFWIFAVSNAINLIDGVDGLASSVSTVSLSTLAIITYYFSESMRMSLFVMLLMLIAAILGFLPFNLAPAKIYLGDTGALFIGFMYGALSVTGLKHASIYSLLIPTTIYMVPLFDAVYAMLRRFITKHPVGVGDSEHLHHRLLRFGFSKRQVVIAMVFLTFIFSVIAIVSQIWPDLRFLWGILSLMIVLILLMVMNQLSKQAGKRKKISTRSQDEGEV